MTQKNSQSSTPVRRQGRAITRRAAASMLAFGPALLTGAGRLGAAEPPKDPPVFHIGALLGLTDKGNWNATVMQRGILQAVDEINAAGGVDGIKLEADIEDHQGNPRAGVDALQRLRARYDIQVILTSYSSVTLAAVPITEQEGIFMINGGAVADSLAGRYKYLFHNRSLGANLARAALSIAKEQKLKKMAELSASTDEGQALKNVAEPDWKAYGGEIVASEQALATASNIDTQMAKIRSSNPDFFAIWEFSPGPGLALKRAREFGMKQPILGIEFTAEIGSVAGAAAEGFQYAQDYFNPSAPDPWPQRFAAGYRKQYGDNPEFYAANYYEAVYIVAESIRRARARGGNYFTGARLAEALKENPRFPSVYGGDMVFEPNGAALKRIGLFIVKNGKPEFQRFAELAK